MDTTQNYTNPNANYFTSGSTFDTSKPIPVSGLTTSPTPVSTPPMSSLPSAENLANYSLSDLTATPSPTATETAKTGVMSSIGDLYKKYLSKGTEQQAMETQAGLPEKNKALTDAINAFRTTTMEQNQLLQEQGAIPLALQEQAQGRGITAGGLAPIQAGELRKNAIKQYQVTSKGLFQQAVVANLRDDIAGAQAAVDKAIKYKYDPIDKEIEYLRDIVLPDLKDTLTKEDAKKAKDLEIRLNERTRLLTNAKEDSTAGANLALTAMNNYPSDKQAQLNAQLAMQEAQKEQPDLNKIFQLVGQYQKDPVATQKALAELTQTRLQNAKLQAEADKIKAETNASNIDTSKLDTQGKAILASVNNLRFSSVEESNRIRKNIADRLAKGDVQGAIDDLKQFGYQKLGESDKADYKLYSGAISAFDSASNQIATQNLTAGPYKALAEKAKPWVSIKNDKSYADLRSVIELGQAQLRKGFYGTAVTGTEAGNANKFLINDSDPISVIKWKVDNGKNFLEFTNDATVAQAVGLPKPNLDDYLTYRVRNKATGQTGTVNRSEYNANDYEILNQ